MDSLQEDLLKLLECPVCLEYMLPPITICNNGHNICNTCKPNLENCPTCRGGLLGVRNKCAEDLAAKFEHPCKFKESGCERKFIVGLKEQHEKVCRYGPHKCPYYDFHDCHWEGTAINLKQHIEIAHKDDIARITTQGMKSNFNLDYTRSIDKGCWSQTVFTLGKIFYYYCEIIGDFLHMCYMYVGSREDDNNYKYTISIKTSDGKQCVSASLLCPNYLDFIDGKFPNEKCAAFYKDFTKLCVDNDDKFPYEYNIYYS